MHKGFIMGLVGWGLLSGCVFVDGSFHKKEVSSFTLLQADNPGLPRDVRATIDSGAHTATLLIPNTVPLNPLVARFSFEGVNATLDGVSIPDGRATLDLGKDHVVAVQGLDEATQSFTIHTKYEGKRIGTFWFIARKNPGLDSDVYGQPDVRMDSWYGSNISTSYMWADVKGNFPNSMVPEFTTNVVKVLWNGAELVSGVTPMTVTGDQNLSLVGIDGSTQAVKVQFSFDPPQLASFGLWMTENTSLRRDYPANVDDSRSVVSVAVPTYVDPKALVPRFTFTGRQVLVAGTPVTRGTTPVDFSQSRTLTVVGPDGKTRDYRLLVTSVAASTATKVTSIKMFGSRQRTPPFVPTSDDSVYGHSSVDAGGSYTITSYGDYVKDPSRVYLEVQTEGILVAAGGHVLTQGSVADGAYDPGNWLDFSKPVPVTITAEDLSTKTITVTLVAP